MTSGNLRRQPTHLKRICARLLVFRKDTHTISIHSSPNEKCLHSDCIHAFDAV